jgi:thioredoxin 1
MKHLLLLFLSITFWSCSNVDSQTLLSPSDFDQKIKEKAGIVFDVRTNEEFEGGHLNAAQNLDIYDSQFEQRLDKLDKSATYYVYCQRGGRSADAVSLMAKKGFKEVYELKGGMESWNKQGLTVANAAQHQPKGEMTVEQYKSLTSQGIVLVDFSAKWCGPCKQMKPGLHKMEKSRAADFKLLMIDVDANETVAKAFEVEVLPTLVWYKNGQVAKRVLGYQSEKQLNATLDEVLKP